MKRILGTSTLTDAVGAEGAEVAEAAEVEQRQRLVELLFDSRELDLGDSDAMAGAWR